MPNALTRTCASAALLCAAACVQDPAPGLDPAEPTDAARAATDAALDMVGDLSDDPPDADPIDADPIDADPPVPRCTDLRFGPTTMTEPDRWSVVRPWGNNAVLAVGARGLHIASDMLDHHTDTMWQVIATYDPDTGERTAERLHPLDEPGIYRMTSDFALAPDGAYAMRSSHPERGPVALIGHLDDPAPPTEWSPRGSTWSVRGLMWDGESFLARTSNGRLQRIARLDATGAELGDYLTASWASRAAVDPATGHVWQFTMVGPLDGYDGPGVRVTVHDRQGAPLPGNAPEGTIIELPPDPDAPYAGGEPERGSDAAAHVIGGRLFISALVHSPERPIVTMQIGPDSQLERHWITEGAVDADDPHFVPTPTLIAQPGADTPALVVLGSDRQLWVLPTLDWADRRRLFADEPEICEPHPVNDGCDEATRLVGRRAVQRGGRTWLGFVEYTPPHPGYASGPSQSVYRVIELAPDCTYESLRDPDGDDL